MIVNPTFDKSIPAEGWIEKNLDKLMSQITQDARQQRPLPLKIVMHPLALRKFIDLLKSKSAFFPNPDGSFSFLKIPVISNSHLPYGCFTVERFKEVGLLK
jgi:hypothetical protein